MLRIMQVPEKHLPLALAALDKDSQDGTFGRRMKGRSNVLSDEFLRSLDRCMGQIGAPIRHDMTPDEFKKVFDQ